MLRPRPFPIRASHNGTGRLRDDTCYAQALSRSAIFGLDIMRLVVGFLVLAVGATPGMHFERKLLADDLTGGYQVVTCDVNGDRKPDIIALASGMPDLVWFENPGWQRHVLAERLPRMINVACWNRAAGTLPEIAVASEFSMHASESAGVVTVLTPGGDPRLPWKKTEIDRLPTSHRLRWANIDGSGNKVLINAPLTAGDAQAPDYRGHVPLVYYRPGEWKRRLIGDAEEGILHGIFVTDWDGNHRDEILIGSFLGIHLYKFNTDGHWTRTQIAQGSPAPWPHSGTSDIAVGSLGKERFLATIEPWHGNQVVVYRERASQWVRNVIDDSLLDAHTVETVDLGGDGIDEILAGFRGKPYGVNLYHFENGQWRRQILDQGTISAAGSAIADLDEDARPDIVCIGQATHNLVLFQNVAAR